METRERQASVVWLELCQGRLSPCTRQLLPAVSQNNAKRDSLKELKQGGQAG